MSSHTAGFSSSLGYMESFLELIDGFQSSFFGFGQAIGSFIDISEITFLIFGSLAVGLFAFFLNVLPALVSQSAFIGRRSQQRSSSGKKGSGS